MTLPRFYVPDLDPAPGTVTLSPEESHHLARVLRLSGGDPVVVFDGRGRQFAGRVDRADRHHAAVTLGHELASAPDHATPIALVQAILKGDKMDEVVRDATMAGASRVVPIVTERSQVRFSSLRRGHVDERWRRVAVASAKQCGQSRLPEIEAPRSFESWLETPAPGIRLLLVEPGGADSGGAAALQTVLTGSRPEAVSCVIGPEGGWSAEERERAAAAGCRVVTLGPMTLRADAAGLVALSVVSYALTCQPG
jgi:16S rRNA (uracil1498-N3)-methyltransferase